MSRGKHGSYPHWLCVTCGFALAANRWRLHRRTCARRAVCAVCRDSFPCRKRMCPEHEKPVEIEDDEGPGEAPRAAVVNSLRMRPRKLADGRWSVSAPWLDGSVVADTWPDAYWLAMQAKPR